MNPLPVVELKCTICKCVSLHVEDIGSKTMLRPCARCHTETLHDVIPFKLTNGRGADKMDDSNIGESN